MLLAIFSVPFSIATHMPRVLNFYMDDSGTRAPNRKPLPFDPRRHEFFALGGVLINEADESAARTAYAEFCHRWSIEYPLHSVEIRHSSHDFSWLKRGADEYGKFMRDLSRFLTTINVVGLACVVDRPGYDARYREKYGRRQWHLCQTAFSIVVERATKYARDNGRKLRVMPERSSRDDERRIRTYFEYLKEKGAPFDSKSSSLYGPLRTDEFCDTLYELRFKGKSSPMAQVADLYLWPLAIAGYDEGNRAYGLLRTAGRLIEHRLPEDQWAERGTKYSCFDLVHQQMCGG
jgi:hypothetical protein